MPMSSTTATPMTTYFITPLFLTGAGTASTSSSSLFFFVVAFSFLFLFFLRVLLQCICHGKSKTGGLREQGVSLDAAADVNCLSSRSREAGKNTSKRIIPPALLHAAMSIVVAANAEKKQNPTPKKKTKKKKKFRHDSTVKKEPCREEKQIY